MNNLRESCIRFREIFLTKMDIDPFRYVTIASTVMDVFKAKQSLTVVDENKITREPLTRKIINKREEKNISVGL